MVKPKKLNILKNTVKIAYTKLLKKERVTKEKETYAFIVRGIHNGYVPILPSSE